MAMISPMASIAELVAKDSRMPSRACTAQSWTPSCDQKALIRMICWLNSIPFFYQSSLTFDQAVARGDFDND